MGTRDVGDSQLQGPGSCEEKVEREEQRPGALRVQLYWPRDYCRESANSVGDAGSGIVHALNRFGSAIHPTGKAV